MRNKLYILIAILLGFVLNSQAQVAQHYFALWGEVGGTMMLTRSDKASPAIGVGGGVGMGYEMQYNQFLLQTGLHINGAIEKLKLKNGDFVLRSSIDTEDYIFDFWYHQKDRKDNYTVTSLQIPLLFGGEFNRFYFLAGAKANIKIYSKAHASGVYSSLGDYEPMIDPFEDMPNHQFFSNYYAVSEEKCRFNFDVLLSGEIGIRFGNLYRTSSDRSKVRLAIYADYGLLDCHVKGDKDIVSLAQTFNAGDMRTSIHPHHFLSTKDATNPVHNLQVGIKLTYLLNSKVGKKRFCPMCNDEFVPRKYKKKCVICLY